MRARLQVLRSLHQLYLVRTHSAFFPHNQLLLYSNKCYLELRNCDCLPWRLIEIALVRYWRGNKANKCVSVVTAALRRRCSTKTKPRGIHQVDTGYFIILCVLRKYPSWACEPGVHLFRIRNRGLKYYCSVPPVSNKNATASIFHSRWVASGVGRPKESTIYFPDKS